VNRQASLVIGIVLLLWAHSSLAQHGGHGGGGGRRAPGAGTAGTSDAGLTDFNHALAVQATPDQASRFQEVSKSTQTAMKLVQDLLRLSAEPGSAADLSPRTAALKDAVEEAQGGNQDFVKSFSKSQKAGLKELTRKLEKADLEVAKLRTALEKQLTEAKANTQAIAGTADKLEKALEEFQSQQISLGKEMGIQTPASSGG
jgi:hypothetical protein